MTQTQDIEIKDGIKICLSLIPAEKSFYMAQTQITQALWKAIMGYNQSHYKGDNLPVECVSWNDCQEFIEKINQITGKKFSLPTETQWQFAAKSCDEQNLDDIAWYYENSDNTTHPVATKLPNKYGLYDMFGNVWEWCEDLYDSSGPYRVVRGGSIYFYAYSLRSACRFGLYPYFAGSNYGFRLCLL